MKKPRIAITEPDWLPDGVEEKLAQVFDVCKGPFLPQDLASALNGAEGALVGLDHVLKGDALPETLKFIVSPTTGLNHIDLDQAERQGIKVISLKGETDFLQHITATAELCWGLVLSLLRRIPAAHTSVMNGQWDRDYFKSRELQGATLGVIGFGRLGKKIAHYGHAFQMRVLICDNKPLGAEGADFTSVDMQTLLKESDIISLQVDSRPDNYHMIGKAEFQAMKQGALFVNTARGDLVDEPALLQSLRDRHLGGAALDVLEQEYDSDKSAESLMAWARDHENLIITPHIGGVTYESQYKTTHFVVDKLLEWYTAHD